MLRIDPRERAGGPVSIQLFGEDPAIMRGAAAHVASIGADAIDINMGCPVPKVRRTGAGAALLADPDLAVALARAAVEGAGAGGPRDREAALRACGPAMRAGLRSRSGWSQEAGVAAIAFHPRSAAVHHKGTPDYELAARLVDSLPAPVIITGGLSDAARVREAFERTGAAAVMLARGCARQPLAVPGAARRQATGSPSAEEVLAELDWTMDRAVEHLGEDRAEPLSAQVLPVVRRAPRAPVRAGPAAAAGASERARPGARARRCWTRACRPLALPA